VISQVLKLLDQPRPRSLWSVNNRELRGAFSLLEVVAGLTVVTLILIPTTGLMRDVLAGEGVQRQRGELIHLAQGKQQELCHMARVNFRESTESGSFAAQGFPELVYLIRCQADAAWGGIPDRLLAIHTTAWHDANRNAQLDVGETSISLWTSVARTTP
jgi:hypothetical protein